MIDTEDNPWQIAASEFPTAGSFAEKARFLLRYATLAPSGHNTQPWLFEITENRLHVYSDRRRALPVVDPNDRELVISCGAAVGVLEIAAAYFGLDARVRACPNPKDPDLLAEVDLTTSKEGPPDPPTLFSAIVERRTTRAHYTSEIPSSELVDACVADARNNKTDFRVFLAAEDRKEIAKLVAEGDRIQFDNPAFRRELANWVHSTQLGSRDGMSGTGFGMPDVLAPVARFVIRTFDLGGGVAASDESKITDGTPILGLLSTAEDNPPSWLKTGLALSRISLHLTAEGFTSSYLNQPIETASLRPRLKQLTGVDGYPQILIRIGKAASTPPPTARRDISDVIMQN